MKKLIYLWYRGRCECSDLFFYTQITIFKIITIANLVPVKGIEVLINAIYKLNNNNICLDIFTYNL